MIKPLLRTLVLKSLPEYILFISKIMRFYCVQNNYLYSMCIVLSGETQPDTTKLMNIPVIIDDKKYNFLCI